MDQHIDCRRTPTYPIRGKVSDVFRLSYLEATYNISLLRSTITASIYLYRVMWSDVYSELLSDIATTWCAVAQWLECTISIENATSFQMVQVLHRSNSPIYMNKRLAINSGR